MKRTGNQTFLGVGIYEIPEASRLTGVSVGCIRRWIGGYTYEYKGQRRTSPPVWERQLPIIGQKISVSFLDLVEIRLVDAFRRRGVGWKTLRMAAERACSTFETSHPFGTLRLKTDGRSVFLTVADQSGDEALLDILNSQYAFKRILTEFLFGLEFGSSDYVLRWWPLGLKRRVVIDPRRSFGQPIVSTEGVPTCVLAKAVQANESVEEVAKWYEVDVRSVRDAIEFEQRLAA